MFRIFEPSSDLRSPRDSTPPPVDFVGEQRGQPENELKGAFRQALAATPTVLSAYLARISRRNLAKPSVAVCIRSAIGVDEKLADRLQEIFRERFRADQRLDSLFLLETDEYRLQEVCQPFYVKRG